MKEYEEINVNEPTEYAKSMQEEIKNTQQFLDSQKKEAGI